MDYMREILSFLRDTSSGSSSTTTLVEQEAAERKLRTTEREDKERGPPKSTIQKKNGTSPPVLSLENERQLVLDDLEKALEEIVRDTYMALHDIHDGITQITQRVRKNSTRVHVIETAAHSYNSIISARQRKQHSPFGAMDHSLSNMIFIELADLGYRVRMLQELFFVQNDDAKQWRRQHDGANASSSVGCSGSGTSSTISNGTDTTCSMFKSDSSEKLTESTESAEGSTDMLDTTVSFDISITIMDSRNAEEEDVSSVGSGKI